MLIEDDFNSLHYARTDNADAPPLLCLHGVTRGWQSYLPLIPTLALRWQVYATDHRGHGKSARAKSYLVTDYVTDAVTFLREAIQRPTVIYGHSLGAMVAAAVAAETPELVRGIILEDPPFETMGTRIRDYVMYPYFCALESFAGSKASLSELVKQLGAIEVETPSGRKAMCELRDASALRFAARCVQQLDPVVMSPIARGEWMRGYDLLNVARRIQCPVLVMQADASAGGMLTDEDVRLLETNIADVTHVKLNGLGHQIHTAAPDVVLRIALGFLESF